MMSLGALSITSMLIVLILGFYWIFTIGSGAWINANFINLIYAGLAAGSVNSLTWVMAEKMERKYYGENKTNEP